MDSLDAAENNIENEEGTDVYFEILTNWGNPKYLGLTEVCVELYTVEPLLTVTPIIRTFIHVTYSSLGPRETRIYIMHVTLLWLMFPQHFSFS